LLFSLFLLITKYIMAMEAIKFNLFSSLCIYLFFCFFTRI
jgi:hypothetical protein